MNIVCLMGLGLFITATTVFLYVSIYCTACFAREIIVPSVGSFRKRLLSEELSLPQEDSPVTSQNDRAPPPATSRPCPEIIRLAVMLYMRLRFLFENLLHGRGIEISNETVRRGSAR